jgi:hypothetical protein
MSNPLASTIPKWRTFKLGFHKKLHHSTWDQEILYTGRSSTSDQLLIRPFHEVTGDTNVGVRLKFDIHILFLETTHETLHLGEDWYRKDREHTYNIYLKYYFV